jgi:hypothetical protein
MPSFLLFVVENKNMYNLNSNIHNINTRQKFNSTNIQQIYLYTLKELISSALKRSIASLKASKKNIKLFKIVLKCYFLTHTICSIFQGKQTVNSTNSQLKHIPKNVTELSYLFADCVYVSN